MGSVEVEWYLDNVFCLIGDLPLNFLGDEMGSDKLFYSEFQVLTGNAPFPWQTNLYNLLVEGIIPLLIDVPTGLGKTSVVAIWLLARAARPDLPTRLVYVVNRRTVVDQTTAEVERIRENLRSSCLADLRSRLGLPEDGELAISTLRGQFNDNRKWLEDPSRPCVVVGTVDMVGSRLLFNGFRTGHWQKARHAGLLGQDALLVHDEAHLEPAFQSLLGWIESKQSSDGSPRRLRVMAMSATNRGLASSAVPVFTSADEENEIVRRRFSEVQKRLFLHDLRGKAKSVETILDLAWQHKSAPSRILIYVRKPDDASAIYKGLIRKLEDAGLESSSRVALLTGTIRGYERELLVCHPAVAGLLQEKHTTEGVSKCTTWLVSTSAGEVGADFDADHAVCDLSTYEAMVQRFGRINRRGGEGRYARIDVVLDLPEPKPGNAQDLARLNTSRLLRLLPHPPGAESDGLLLASPAAFRKLMQDHPSECAAASSPIPPSTQPHDAVLDAWTLTSIRSPWSLCHEVDPYLHGNDPEAPETHVAWRSVLDVLSSYEELDLGQASQQLLATLDHHPLRPLELLREPTWRLSGRIAAMASSNPDALAAILGQRSLEVIRFGSLRDAKALLPRLVNRTLLLPPSIGGLSSAGMLDPVAVARTGMDVSMMTAGPGNGFVTDRACVLVARKDGEWSAECLGSEPSSEPGQMAPGPFGSWTEARRALQKRLGMAFVSQTAIAADEEGTCARLLFFRKVQEDDGVVREPRILLEHHLKDAGTVAEAMVKRLCPNQAEAKAIHLAALTHDSGKQDLRWQRAIGNPEGSPPLAKSTAAGFNWRALDGYRHEYGSLGLLLADTPAWGSEEIRDLVLHLIGTHHGRARPHFDAEAIAGEGSAAALMQPGEVARRFARLQDRYGPWGLAWLEAILMAADGESSAHPATWDGDGIEEEEA